ncbi:D-glycero-alpha-D-manno-heptose-1,7-bisphosphate 7-phosphatase [Leucobacter ruminantium]|uniref:D,D-heptose 1,7-bisphosphate phosphatase n=1 Tax=Leucobacter ruminantium TaxID=1289170 RepID=A0A939LZH6_9MICO|nr:HAD-IIIA family hydrolase [Leucobacter ruminantium]MBO1804315.1 HAD-IIIA family hydrolase [Leucobacter ruminantium]
MEHDIEAFLFDRDDTLIVDVPYNGDPSAVVPMPTVEKALERLRSLGFPLGVVSNQSGIARGIVSAEAVQRVNDRVAEVLGGFDVWRICPHAPEDGCECRKPRPAMILSAAAELGIAPERVAMIGDIGADVAAARAAGAVAVLVPTARTRPEECATAPLTAETVGDAVDLLLAGSEGRR